MLTSKFSPVPTLLASELLLLQTKSPKVAYFLLISANMLGILQFSGED